MRLALRLAVVAAAMILVTTPAGAQGTDAQRAACAADALTLCPDTIPDVGRTRACMAAHFVSLRPRCQAVFEGATPPRPRRHYARIRRSYRTARGTGAYHIPRFNQAEAEAEVHEIFPYRTPYPYPAIFGPW